MTVGGASTIRVCLFAGLREAMGWRERLVHVDAAHATPLLLWRQLELDHGWSAACAASPDRSIQANCSSGKEHADALPSGVRVAINQAFAAADTPLTDGDELAFLPPISGG